MVLPQDCNPKEWQVHNDTKFVVEPDVTCDLITPNSVSEFIQELVVTQRIAAEMEKEARNILVCLVCLVCSSELVCHIKIYAFSMLFS